MLHVNFRDLFICSGKSFKIQRGSHHLEFSLVLPLLFFLVLGAFDINSALQSYTALQEGVRKSLRCVYTTDGRCTSGDPGSANANYKVTGIQGTKTYIVDKYDYSADVRYLQMPVYSAQPIVEVLDTVSYNTPLSDTKFMGEIQYFIQTQTLPYVSGNDPFNPNYGTNPTFATVNSGNSVYPPLSDHAQFTDNKTINSFISLNNGQYHTADSYDENDTSANQEGVYIAETRLMQIDRPFSRNSLCFRASELNSDTRNMTANFGSQCDMDEALLLFQIKGTTIRRNSTSRGKVLIKLVDENDRLIDHLGGRIIDSNPGSNNDFATRGLERVGSSFPNASESITRSYPDESYKHSRISIPYNKKFKIVFMLRSFGGEIGWQPDSIDLFTSVFEARNENNVECSDWVLAGNSKPAACKTNHPSGAYAANLSEKTHRDSDQSTLITENCHDNYGSTNIAADCLKLCPPSNSYRGEVSCSVRDKILENFEYFISDCNYKSPGYGDYPEELKKYAVIKSISFSQNGKYKDISGNGTDPAKTRNENSSYSCTNLVNIKLDDSYPQKKDGVQYPQLRNDSLFVGSRYTLGDNWEQILKDHARSILAENTLNPDAFIKVAANTNGLETFTTKPPYPYKMEVKNPDPKSKVDLGASDGKSMPPECKDGTYVCKIEFNGYTDGTFANAEIDENLALNIGRSEILSSFPRANFTDDDNCTADYCTRYTGVVDEVTNTARYSASMQVPMLLLGNQSIRIAYEDNHRLERRYSK